MRIPTTCAKTNSHWKVYLNPFRPYFHFVHLICPLRKPPSPCDAPASIVFSPFDTPRPPIWRGDPHRTCGTQTWASHSISDMARIGGGHTDSSLSRNLRPRASSPQDSTSQAPEALTIPSSEGGVSSNPILQLVISPSFQLQIVIRLKHWILDFLSFKIIDDFP